MSGGIGSPCDQCGAPLTTDPHSCGGGGWSYLSNGWDAREERIHAAYATPSETVGQKFDRLESRLKRYPDNAELLGLVRDIRRKLNQ